MSYRRSESSLFLILLASVFTLFLLASVLLRIVSYINFDQNCEGYLKRAADANTIELARENLDTAIGYLEREGLVKGYTSIFYRTPDEDIEFWHGNLKASLHELEGVKLDAAPLERSNILMKLRETLLDREEVTSPAGISIYPNNSTFFWISSISGLLAFLAWLPMIIKAYRL